MTCARAMQLSKLSAEGDRGAGRGWLVACPRRSDWEVGSHQRAPMWHNLSCRALSSNRIGCKWLASWLAFEGPDCWELRGCGESKQAWPLGRAERRNHRGFPMVRRFDSMDSTYLAKGFLFASPGTQEESVHQL